MKQSKAVLKSYFETGDKPTQTQFEDLIDSFVHEDDVTRIYVTGVERNQATGDSEIKLSNGSKLLIQNPANVINQDNKVKVVDLGNIRFDSGGMGEVRRERVSLQEEVFSEKVDAEPRIIGEVPVRGDIIVNPFPTLGGIEKILASTVNRLNPPITIEEDEIVIFQYNIVQQLQS